MTDESNNSYENPEDERFEDLLLGYERKGSVDIQAGDRVEAKVVSIGRESVFVDIGTVMDGVIEKDELVDEEGQVTCKIGDKLELYVVSVSDGEVRLSRALSGAGGLKAIRDAFENQLPVEGRVLGKCKGGYEVSLMHRRAFCPGSQIDLRYAEDEEQYVGKTYRFVLTRFEEGGRNIVVSRRRLLERELEKAREEFFATLKQGDILDGKVTRLAQFGAFVEIFPGVEGMVHISELSWSRVNSPEEVLRVSDRVKVKVLSVALDEATGKPRISLSIKGAGPDPWESVHNKYQVGQIVKGKVTRCASFGAFVQLEPGVEGLVHISEMSYTKRVLKPEEIVTQGEVVKVMIKEIDHENRRISLSVKDVEGDPWAHIIEQYKEGQTVEGRLERKEHYGYIVSLAPGLAGLIPKSVLERSPQAPELEKCKEGDLVSVMIRQINQPEKKITLEPSSGVERSDWKRYGSEKASFGSLGDKLREALRKKNDS